MTSGLNRVIPKTVAYMMLLLPLVLQVGCTLFEKQSNVTSYDPLRLEIEIDRSSCVKGGEHIHIRYTVTNRYDKPFIIESKDTPVLDITVEVGPDVALAWSKEHPDLVQHRVEWQPGESKTLELDWIVPERNYFAGMYAVFEGRLNRDSKSIQGVSNLLCLGAPFEPR